MSRESTATPGHSLKGAADGEGHFGHVHGALGIDRDAMGGDELTGALALFGAAEHTDPVAFQIVNGHTVAQPGRFVNSAHAVQFTDVDMILPQHHRVGAVDVVPHV